MSGSLHPDNQPGSRWETKKRSTRTGAGPVGKLCDSPVAPNPQTGEWLSKESRGTTAKCVRLGVDQTERAKGAQCPKTA